MQILERFRLSDADTGGGTSTVGEPSVSNVGQEIFVTGNWYASRSTDNGVTWSHVDPFTFFPDADDGFCCDQTVHHDPTRDLTFWLLQYSNTTEGNTLRIAVNKGTVLDSWHWWDLVPSQINPQWKNEWFDYNHAAISDNFLYVATNVFTTANDSFVRAVVFRLPLDDLGSPEQDLDLQFFETDEFSVRCTQGATDVMYFACHIDGGQIRLFQWPESSSTASFQDIQVGPWIGGASGYSAPGPDGKNWLRRCDPRVTGGWIANGFIGFMWSADRSGARPFPHIRVVRIDQNTHQLIDEPDIWNTSFAYAYPDAYPNVDGKVGITLFRGGGNLNPSHAVGVWDDNTETWTVQAAVNGTNGPADGKWGDYITCRRHSPDGKTLLAIGFTLQGGNQRKDIEPCVVHFEP